MNKTFVIAALSITLLVIIALIGLPHSIRADTADIIKLENPIKATTTEELINNILQFIWEIALVATPVMIVIGAFIITTSAGNPEQVKTGKNTIVWALAGFALILLSKGLFALIQEIIGA